MGSIINDKYKGQYRKPGDWLADLLDKVTAKTRTVERTVKVKGDDGKETERTESRTLDDGKDTSVLFAIAGENNLDPKKIANLQTQSEQPGFPGRARMTIGNMLRSTTKKRHGLFLNGEWTPAPADWLSDKGAPAEPTETQTGEKIAKAKPEKPAKEVATNDVATDDATNEAAPKEKRRRRAVHQDAA